MPVEDLALPVERQGVGVAADQHVRDQARGGEAAGQHPLRSRRLKQGAAGPAGAFRPGDPDDPELCGDPVQHLAAGRARIGESAAAVRLALVQSTRHVAHQMVQHADVGRQVVERDPHTRSVSARPRLYKQKGTAYPASTGCRDRTSVRHSRPSKSIESWAGISVIEVVPSGVGCVDSHTNRPWSKRL